MMVLNCEHCSNTYARLSTLKEHIYPFGECKIPVENKVILIWFNFLMF